MGQVFAMRLSVSVDIDKNLWWASKSGDHLGAATNEWFDDIRNLGTVYFDPFSRVVAKIDQETQYRELRPRAQEKLR